MAGISVRPRSVNRSVARRFSAQPCYLSERQRTDANGCTKSTSWGSLVRAQYRPLINLLEARLFLHCWFRRVGSPDPFVEKFWKVVQRRCCSLLTAWRLRREQVATGTLACSQRQSGRVRLELHVEHVSVVGG